MTNYGTRIRSLCLSTEFERKCAVGLLGYSVGTFSRQYICLGSAIVVDSSFVLYPCDSIGVHAYIGCCQEASLYIRVCYPLP